MGIEGGKTKRGAVKGEVKSGNGQGVKRYTDYYDGGIKEDG